MTTSPHTIAGMLVKHGYSLAGIGTDYVKVNDQVRDCSNPPQITSYNVETIRTLPEAFKFIEERR